MSSLNVVEVERCRGCVMRYNSTAKSCDALLAMRARHIYSLAISRSMHAAWWVDHRSQCNARQARPSLLSGLFRPFCVRFFITFRVLPTTLMHGASWSHWARVSSVTLGTISFFVYMHVLKLLLPTFSNNQSSLFSNKPFLMSENTNQP